MIFEWSLKNIKLLTILSYIIISYIIFFIIYGAYEFTYNFNRTLDNVKLEYDIKSLDRNKTIDELNSIFLSKTESYKMSFFGFYISNFILLLNLLIVIRLFIHKLYNNINKSNYFYIFCSLTFFAFLSYLFTLIFSIAYSTINIFQQAYRYNKQTISLYFLILKSIYSGYFIEYSLL
jgi:hypothetical protein